MILAFRPRPRQTARQVLRLAVPVPKRRRDPLLVFAFCLWLYTAAGITFMYWLIFGGGR